MVVNAPQSNIVSAAEHTMALLLAQARNVPQAHAALDRRPLGAQPVGGCRAGRQDARHRRPRPDRQARRRPGPGVRDAPRRLRPVRLGRPGPADGRRAAVARPGRSPRPTSSPIHLPKTKETTGLIGRDLLLKAKPTLRDHQRRPRRHRRRAGAGRRDPRRGHRRRRARRVRHRADHRVAAVRARQRRRHAAPRRAARARRRTRPATRSPTWCSSRWPASSCRSRSTSTRPRPTRRCGRSCRWPSGSGGCSRRSSGELADARSRCAVEGDIAGYDTRIVGSRVLKGFFGRITDEPVTYVNAPQLAKEHGVEVREINCATSADYVNLVTVARRRALDVGHDRRPPRRAAHRDDRRAHVRRAAGRRHADGQERRPARASSASSARCSATPASTSPTWTSAAPTPTAPR